MQLRLSPCSKTLLSLYVFGLKCPANFVNHVSTVPVAESANNRTGQELEEREDGAKKSAKQHRVEFCRGPYPTTEYFNLNKGIYGNFQHWNA